MGDPHNFNASNVYFRAKRYTSKIIGLLYIITGYHYMMSCSPKKNFYSSVTQIKNENF